MVVPAEATGAEVMSWKGVETTSALQAQSHGEVMETQCLQAPSVFWTSCEHAGTGLRRVGHHKKAAAAEGRRRLFEVHDDVLSRRVRTKSKKHYVPAGTASP